LPKSAVKGRDVDDVEKNRRSAGNTRANASHERWIAKHADDPAPPTPPAVPMVSISEDDPRYIDAVAEANRRFDEFLSAFEVRTPADLFEVKSAFRDDFGKEFMWFTVSQVDEDYIHGMLDNDPAQVKSVKRGQRVKILRKQVNDWLYVREGQFYGGFTVKIVQDKNSGNVES
jgi:uncharacterized protein YegJ (DUF2314 family)